ncbi:hypothetical protein YB2330_002334 [Saitoella coloradoensis]
MAPLIALVSGATGINGRAQIENLTKSSNKWTKIYAVSRSVKEKYPENVQHVALDLMKDPKELGKQLKEAGVQGVTHIFWAAYKEEAEEEKACEVNGGMLKNFMEAFLADQAASKEFKRIVLVTGMKHYGVHLGSYRLPGLETDPRIDGPNFYYTQEDILADLCGAKPAAKNGSWDIPADSKWDFTINRPNDICGYSKGNYMSLATTIAIYASVQKELGEPLWWPGNERFYRGWDDSSYAPLIAEFGEWQALEEGCGGEAFNCVNGDLHTWSRTWPKIAEYFGLELPEDQFNKPAPLPHKVELPGPSPLTKFLKTNEPAGADFHTPTKSLLTSRVHLETWSQKPEVSAAWSRLADRHDLDKEAFSHATWGFMDFCVGRTWDILDSMGKARAMGWTGYQDTLEGYLEVFGRLREGGAIPKE